jgi:hypothetical protein
MPLIPDIKIRGIRTPIPSGYVLGRTAGGTGDVHLIPIDQVGGIASASGFGSGNSIGATAVSASMTATQANQIAQQALTIAQIGASNLGGGETEDGGGTTFIGIPGAPGAAGAAGAASTVPGPAGPPGIAIDGNEGDEGPPIPFTSPRIIEFVFSFDGGGAAPAVNSIVDLSVNFACTLLSSTLLADISGSCVLDVWVKAFSTSSPPAVANTITASALPTLSGATGASDTTLTGWTRSIAAGSSIRVNVNSASTLTKATLTLAASIP